MKNAPTAPTSVAVNADPAQAGSGLAAKDFRPGKTSASSVEPPLPMRLVRVNISSGPGRMKYSG